MIAISVKHDLDGIVKKLDRIQREQVPTATRNAINSLARIVVEREKREIRDVFDRPTPYTQSAVAVFKGATRQNLQAVVGIKNDTSKGVSAAKFLAASVSGGLRKQKRFEKALQAVGAMPSGYRAVPGDAARIDSYGNMLPAQIVQILSFFKAFPEAGYKANMTDKTRARMKKGSKGKQGFEYFVGRPGDRLPLGIWQRFNMGHGSAIKPVMIFVPNAVYQAVFDFGYVGKLTAEREFPAEFAKAMNEAMARTA